MLAAVALAIQSAPPAPIVADYFPGPWFVPVEGRGDRLSADAIPIIARVADAAARVPIAVEACVERREGGAISTRDRRLLGDVRRRLMANGIPMGPDKPSRCEPVHPPRGVDGVMLHPVPR